MTTRRIYWQGAVFACGVVLLALWLGSPLWAQPTQMLREYGTARQQGEYEGTLYCLRHDFSQDKKDHEICQKEGWHRHVLLMANGHVHPLYGDNEELNNLINSSDMNAKKVHLTGKYYVTTNAILVGSIKVLQ
jgi:hypothetical protein